MSTTMPSSSGASGSSVANCEASRSGGKKCPSRAGEPRLQHLGIAVQVHEAHPRRAGPEQSRDRPASAPSTPAPRTARRPRARRSAAASVSQPRPAVGVLERDMRRHLGDVGRRVVAVALVERPAERCRQPLADAWSCRSPRRPSPRRAAGTRRTLPDLRSPARRQPVVAACRARRLAGLRDRGDARGPPSSLARRRRCRGSAAGR